MTFKLLAVSAALIGFTVTGAVIPGICDEASSATPVRVAAASQQVAPDFADIIDQSGKIVFQHAGEGSYGEIDRMVAKLLNVNS